MTALVIQEIVITWGKEARGGEAAVQRSALPEVFPLPHLPMIKHPLALVHHSSNGTDYHKLTVEPFEARKTIYIGCAAVSLEGDRISVIFRYNRDCGGAPDRTNYPRQVLNLTLGTWGQIIYNGRFSGWDAFWYYKKQILNIGYFDTPHEDVFLTPPQRVFRELAQLW